MPIKNNIQRIETPRLILRKYKMSDASELKALVDNNIEHLIGWMPWVKREPTSLLEKQNMLHNWIRRFEANKDFFYGIFLKENKELIGSTGFHKRLGRGILEIGYWISQDKTRQGYATEASYALSKVGLLYAGAEKMEIRCAPENVISAHIPAILGYRKEYTLRTLLKGENGERYIHDAWTLFKEEFEVINKYEPVVV